MKPDSHHERVMGVFLGACDLEGEEQKRYLNGATEGEPELRREVEQLLDKDYAGTITPVAERGASDAPQPEPQHHAASERYEIREELARGGTAAVFLARDKNLSRDVALKRLLESRRDDREAKARMLREAVVASGLEHPGVPAVHEIGKFEDGEPYIAYRLVRGATLSQLLKERDFSRDAEVPRFLEIFERICQPVAYAHARDILHRDLKPDNVMVDEFGDVQVMDWGLAVRKGDAPLRKPGLSDGAGGLVSEASPGRHTRVGAIMGTPAYMAPEQSIGRGGKRSDVFGLGAILCELLTGQPPFVAKSQADVYVKAVKGELAEAVERLGHCGPDPELVKLAVRCIAPEPEDRLADAGVLLESVTAYRRSFAERLRNAELAAAEAEATAREERKRRKWVVALGAAALGLLGALWFNQHREEERRAAQREEGRVAIASAEELTMRWMADLVGNLKAEEAAVQAHETAAEIAAPDDRQLEKRLLALGVVIGREQGHRRFARTLARLELGMHSGFSWYYRERELIPIFADVFAGAEFDLRDAGVEAAAERIRSFSDPVRRTVVESLAKWVAVEAPKKRADSWPMRVLIAVEPDPWLLRWQEALATAKSEPLVDLGNDPAVLERSPFEIAVLAYTMRWTPRERKMPYTEETVSLLRRAGLRYPENFEIKVLLSTLLSESVHGEPPVDESAAARYALAAVSLRPGAATWCRYGRLLRTTGDKEGAKQALESALEFDPNHPGSLYELGYAYLDTDQPGEAVNYFERLVARGEVIASGSQASFHSALGIAARRVGNNARAEEALLKAIELALKDRFTQAYLHTYYGELGTIYRGQGRWEEAVAVARKAIALKPEQMSAHLNLARALKGAGYREKALEAARTAARLTPDSVEARVFLQGLRPRTEDPTAE